MDPKHRGPHRIHPRLFSHIRPRHDSFSIRVSKKSSPVQLAQLPGNERETVDVVFPATDPGLVGHDSFGIGDTLTTASENSLQGNSALHARGIFCICTIRTRENTNNSAKASTSFLQEGVIQAVVSAQLVRQDAAARRRLGPLHLKSCIPARKRIRRGIPARSRAVERRPLVADRHQGRRNSTRFRPRPARASPTTSAKIPSPMGNEWSANYFGETNKNTPLSAVACANGERIKS